jgi:hypothetical protein
MWNGNAQEQFDLSQQDRVFYEIMFYDRISQEFWIQCVPHEWEKLGRGNDMNKPKLFSRKAMRAV